MLSVFRRVEGWFSKHEDCLLRVTSQVIKDTPMPEFLHHVPVFNNSSFNRVYYFMSAVEISRFFTYCEIESLCDFFIAHGPSGLGALVTYISNEGGYVEGRLGVSGVSHFGVACAVVNDRNLAIKVHKICNYNVIWIYSWESPCQMIDDDSR